MPTKIKSSAENKIPKGLERLTTVVDKDCERRSLEIALEMARKSRAAKKQKLTKTSK